MTKQTEHGSDAERKVKKEISPYTSGDHYASEEELRESYARSYFFSVNPFDPKYYEEEENK